MRSMICRIVFCVNIYLWIWVCEVFDLLYMISYIYVKFFSFIVDIVKDDFIICLKIFFDICVGKFLVEKFIYFGWNSGCG